MATLDEILRAISLFNVGDQMATTPTPSAQAQAMLTPSVAAPSLTPPVGAPSMAQAAPAPAAAAPAAAPALSMSPPLPRPDTLTGNAGADQLAPLPTVNVPNSPVAAVPDQMPQAPLAAPASAPAAAPRASSGGNWGDDVLSDPNRLGYLQAGLAMLQAFQDKRTSRGALAAGLQGYLGGRAAAKDAQFQNLRRSQVTDQIAARQAILNDPSVPHSTKQLISLLGPEDYGRVVAAQQTASADFNQRLALAGVKAQQDAAQPQTDLAKLEADFKAGRIDEETYKAAREKMSTSGSSAPITIQGPDGRPVLADPKTFQPIRGPDGNLVRPTDTRSDVVTQQETGLRGEVEKRLAPIRTQIGAFQTLQSSLGQDNGVGDMAAIYQFMKALDPTSVVREGEFATAQNSSGLPTTITNYYNKLVNGDRLSATQRREFLSVAREAITAQRRNVEQDVATYRGIAQRNGYNQDNIFLPLNWPEEPKAASQATGAASQGTPDRSAIEAEMRRRGLL